MILLEMGELRLPSVVTLIDANCACENKRFLKKQRNQTEKLCQIPCIYFSYNNAG